MSARTFLSAGLVISSVFVCGCMQRPYKPSVPAQPAPNIQASASQQTNPWTQRGESAPAAAAASGNPAPQMDDASLLARQTSEYAQSVTPLLNQTQTQTQIQPQAQAQTPAPSTQPSIVQWVEPSSKQQPQSGNAESFDRGPVANRPVTLQADQLLKQDTSMPMILPESADHITDASTSGNNSGGNSNMAPPSPSAMATDDYEQRLQKLVHDYPRDLGNQLDYQLLRFVRDEPTPDLSDVAQLSAEDRDLLLALMDGLNNFRAAVHGDGNVMLNRKIDPLLEMADRLRSQAQLEIPTVAFCTQVSSYGVYRPMPSSRFPAGRANEMIVYCEAANFTSVRGNDSLWRTRLQQQMVLYTDTGLAVWPETPNAASFVDQSRNRRHDFFISRKIELPPTLAPGKYVLKITLTDEESNRVVEASAPLEIVADVASTESPAAYTPDSNLPTLSP